MLGFQCVKTCGLWHDLFPVADKSQHAKTAASRLLITGWVHAVPRHRSLSGESAISLAHWRRSASSTAQNVLLALAGEVSVTVDVPRICSHLLLVAFVILVRLDMKIEANQCVSSSHFRVFSPCKLAFSPRRVQFRKSCHRSAVTPMHCSCR